MLVVSTMIKNKIGNGKTSISSRFLLLSAGLAGVDLIHKASMGHYSGIGEVSTSAATGVALAILFTWLAPKLKLKRVHLATYLGLLTFSVKQFNNLIEGYFFTDTISSISSLVGMLLISLATGLLSGVLAGSLLQCGGSSLGEVVKGYLSGQSRKNIVKRIITGTLAYFPIYFLIGMLVTPIIMPYYNDPSTGLKIPPFTLIIGLQVFRGLVYVITLLPLIAAIRIKGRTLFMALSGCLFVLGVLVPVLIEASLPAPVLLVHTAELFTDAILYGYALTRIMGVETVPAGTPKLKLTA